MGDMTDAKSVGAELTPEEIKILMETHIARGCTCGSDSKRFHHFGCPEATCTPYDEPVGGE